MLKGIGAFVVLLMLAGCTPPVDPNAPLRVKVSGDEFSKEITLTGPLYHQERLASYEGETWGLRSFIDPKARTATHQLYAELDYNRDIANNVYFAADNSARDYKPKVIYRERCKQDRYCTIDTDHLTLDVDEATLRANAATGMAFKFSANSGYASIIRITPQMIAAQLDAEQKIMSGALVVGQTIKSGQSIVTASMSPPSTPGQTPSPPASNTKPFLGMAPRDLPFGVGVMVDRVDPGMPAERAGFQVGDMLIRYDGQPIKDADGLRAMIGKSTPGSAVKVDITRKGTPLTLTPQL